MESLHWPLAVLSRAVHFRNLTAASSHVGLSQPQLSRLVHQLEKEYSVVLLDRSVKRKSAWTPAAFRLADVYSQSNRKLQSALRGVLEAQIPTHVTIGTLEGLRTAALALTHRLFRNQRIELIEVDVFDQVELEQKFVNGDLDVIVSSRNPTRQKLRHSIEVGYQTLDPVVTNNSYIIMSSFEHGRIKKRAGDKADPKKTLISNSLSIRQEWLNKFGGEGIVPSVVKRDRGQNTMPVLILASEMFHDGLWEIIEDSAGSLFK